MTRGQRRAVAFVGVIAVVIAILLAIGVIASGGTPDATRERVNHDLAITFANQWRLQHRLVGKPAPAGFTASTDCHHTPKGSADRGPGTWYCTVEGHVPAQTRPLQFSYIALVDGTSCYTALDSDLPPNVTTVGGKTIANPLAAFDSCFNVYDSRTA